ncbi:MAG: hypothetical protein AB7O62_02045 [Pirellulales bacterium]
MPAAGRLKRLFLSYLSRPQPDRLLYRAVRRHRARRIVELGIGDTRRAVRLIEMAQAGEGIGPVAYTGVDLFEMRAAHERPATTLKGTYRQLRATGASIRLLPGDPFAALSRGANNLLGTDMLIVSADQHGEALERAWFYVPRMLHAGSLVFLETPGVKPEAPSVFRQLSLEAVEALAHPRGERRRAA